MENAIIEGLQRGLSYTENTKLGREEGEADPSKKRKILELPGGGGVRNRTVAQVPIFTYIACPGFLENDGQLI